MEDFSCLRVRFVSASGLAAVHSVYCKRHRVRKQSEKFPNDRTLFSIGWPPYVSELEVKNLFSPVGHVFDVCLQRQDGTEEERGFQKGYVVFSDDVGVTAALELCVTRQTTSCTVESVGLRRWIHEYAMGRPQLSVMERGVDEGVREYDTRQEAKEEEQKRQTAPDEEGWVTVTRKRPLQPQTQPQTKKKKKKLVNFYAFQQRETQREHIADLRRRFEEDKQRVAEMKARRKFKPF